VAVPRSAARTLTQRGSSFLRPQLARAPGLALGFPCYGNSVKRARTAAERRRETSKRSTKRSEKSRPAEPEEILERLRGRRSGRSR
jgi:hypothetical protein